MLFSLMQVLCMHTVATPTMQIHIGVATVVDHNLFGLACLVTFSLNASRITLDSVIFWNAEAKKNMVCAGFVVKILYSLQPDGKHRLFSI